MRLARARLAWAVLGLGLAFAAVVQLVAPAASPPLYDGVVSNEPYVWLSPPPGAQGGAQGAAAVLPVNGGTSPLVAVATPELDPQAQVFAVPGSLVLPAGTTSLSVEIAPIPPPAQPTDGTISGNVYAFKVVDQAGRTVTAPASAQVSVVLRAADANLINGSIARFKDGAWQRLQTSAAGLAGAFLAVVTEFGDFAVLAPSTGPGTSAAAPSASVGPGPSVALSPAPSPSPIPAAGGPGPAAIVGGAALGIVVVVALAAYLTRRATRDREYRDRRRRRR